jgi:signal-transduction protein with cAMP-binding, CBS, and nucleotidyltransferase domain
MDEHYPETPSLLTQSLLQTKISTLNPPAPLCVNSTESVETVLGMLRSNSLGSVLIQKPDKTLEGIFTEQDSVRRIALSGADLASPISKHMTPEPKTLRSRASIARAIYSMAKGNFRHLPLVSADRIPEGVLSVRDTVRYIFSLILDKRSSRTGQFLNAEALSAFLNSSVETLKLKQAIVLDESSPVQSALQQMTDARVGALIAVDSKRKLQGIFTERDFLSKLSEKKDWLSPTIASVMSRNPAFARSGSTLKHCVQLMSEGGYRHIPIVDRDDHPLHILSVRDFINSFGDSVVSDLETEKQERVKEDEGEKTLSEE